MTDPNNVKSLNLVCANCEKQSVQEITSGDLVTKHTHIIRCPHCKKEFLSKIVTIRSKKSRGNKKQRKRSFDVRVKYFDGREDLIQFVNNDYQDIEFKSKDLAVFSYDKKTLKIVQNMTLNSYTKIKKGCYIATYVYGEQSYEVALLQQFRDDVLQPFRITSYLVKIYYHISPIMIEKFGNNSFFRMVTKALLKPIVWIVGQKYKPDRG